MSSVSSLSDYVLPYPLQCCLSLSVEIVSRNRSASLRNALFSVIFLVATLRTKTDLGWARSCIEAQGYH